MNWAYLGGYVDGEGSFGIQGTPRMQLGNTHWPTMRQIADFLGVPLRGPYIFRGATKPIWRITVRGDKLHEVLPQLIPHLIEKRREAEVCRTALYDTLRPGQRLSWMDRAIRTTRLEQLHAAREARNA